MDKKKIASIVGLIISLVAGAIAGASISLNVATTEGGTLQLEASYRLELSEEQVPAVIEGDQGELFEDNTIPTVEEVDGGLFEDVNNLTSVMTTDAYYDLGWAETYDVSSPDAFKNATIGRCIVAGNYWGAQCVSLARVYWWSYADRDVSTCGTGMAKGMMNCAEENAGDDFIIYWADSKDKIQAGDWLVFNGGQYGHVGMALGPVVNGYVALLGENQGGKSCGTGVGGSATNIININIKNLIGFYRPKAYAKPEPTPEPEPAPVSDCERRAVNAGDTMGEIMLECVGELDWDAVDEYAAHWHSVKYVLYDNIYDGWQSENGYGLFAEDVIEYR